MPSNFVNEEKLIVLQNIFNILGKANGACSATDFLLIEGRKEEEFLMKNRSYDLIRLVWTEKEDSFVLYYSIKQNSFVFHL